MFPNGLILARWSLREALFENLCVWLQTTRAGSKMDIVDIHSPRLGRDENFLQTSDAGEESSEERDAV